jgi:dolichyl-phosphate beta-glucosyltransferase
VIDVQQPVLSIVVPAYNEESRLPATLTAIDAFAERQTFPIELIVADDGSEDATLSVAQRFVPGHLRYRVLALPHRGKAHTVRSGLLAAEGAFVLFTDADLSTPIEYALQLKARLARGADVAIGSREGAGATRVSEPGYRHLMGRLFNMLVQALAVPGIRDTQCGFKAFRRDVLHDVLPRARLHVDGNPVRGPRVTGFDVEILYIARALGYRIVEVPVYWAHVPGSKVRPLQDSFRMFFDVVRVRLNAIRGVYRTASRVDGRD